MSNPSYITKYGVCYDLAYSPYIAKMGNYKFHFSSMFYYQKFCELLPLKNEKLAKEFKRRFKITAITVDLAAIASYLESEKRGFYITIGGEPVTCLDQIQLSGHLKKGNL